MQIDEINYHIIRELRDGRRSFKKIADGINVTENTIRSRVNKLIDEGLISINGEVDPNLLPGHELVVVGVKLNTMDLVKKGEEFSTLHGVVSVCVVTGRYDLLVTVLLNEAFGLLEFYTKEVQKVQDVLSVETFVVYKGYNMKVPYVI